MLTWGAANLAKSRNHYSQLTFECECLESWASQASALAGARVAVRHTTGDSRSDSECVRMSSIISSLSPAQVALLSTTAISGLKTTDIAALSTSQAAAVTSTQDNRLNAP